VFFLDEAHLLFTRAAPAFLDAIAQTFRLVRSKGVGVFFVTQNPTDLPDDVLGQLGNRIQHGLRAFTPDDADALRKTVRTYPTTEAYDLAEALTALGIGERTPSNRPTGQRAHDRGRPAIGRRDPSQRWSSRSSTPLRSNRSCARPARRWGAACSAPVAGAEAAAGSTAGPSGSPATGHGDFADHRRSATMAG